MTRALTPWVEDVVNSYFIGQDDVLPSSQELLSSIQRRQYVLTFRSVLGFDIRQFKQADIDELETLVRELIAANLGAQIIERIRAVFPRVNQTTQRWIRRTTQLAIQNQWTPTEARQALNNYIRSQRLVIAVTDSQWAVETARRTAIITINDPLQNSLERIAELLQNGQVNEANRLSRQIVRLSRLPTSVNQGQFIRAVNDQRDRLLTPITQGEAINTLRQRAEELGRIGKQWQTIGDSLVRPDHVDVNGQQRPVDQPFSLQGGMLQYPGDASLGASLDEIINCRCVSVYI